MPFIEISGKRFFEYQGTRSLNIREAILNLFVVIHDKNNTSYLAAPVHQLFKFQEDIGLYLDESTGFFYCPKQKHYLDPTTQQWMFYSSMYSVYIPSEDGDTEEKLKLEKHEEMYQKVNRMLEEKRRNRESENGESSSPFVPNFNPRLPYYALRFPVHAQRMPLLPQPRQQYPNFDYGVKNPRFFSG